MRDEVKAKAKELIREINENLGGQRFFLRLAQGKVLAVIFVDPNSPSYEEFVSQRLSQPHERKEMLRQYEGVLNESKDKLISALEKALRGEITGIDDNIAHASDELNRIQELQDRMELEIQIDADPPLGQVFAILTGVMRYCDRHYDNPDKLQKLLQFLAKECREDARS